MKDAGLKGLGDNRLEILAASSTGEAFLKEPEHMAEIQAVIEKATGKTIELVIASREDDPHADVGIIDMEQIIHMEIEIEDIEE